MCDMPRKRKLFTTDPKDFMEVRAIGPGCIWNGWIRPGETATVPVNVAREWIQLVRAVAVAAEVKEDDIRTNNE
jgi:hypothetical protein